jgi:hypothetical protein
MKSQFVIERNPTMVHPIYLSLFREKYAVLGILGYIVFE